MKRVPALEELVGSKLEPDERERLARIHELLLIAGPAPRLSPRIKQSPRRLRRRGHSWRQLQRPVVVLAAALAALLLAFLGGFVAGNRSANERTSARLIKLAGTQGAPHALASLRIAPSGGSGNWSMQLSASGLPKLPPDELYQVYLVREDKLYASCGSFRVTSRAQAISVSLNAPYPLQRGDTWVVTREHVQRDGHEASTVVLRPTT